MKQPFLFLLALLICLSGCTAPETTAPSSVPTEATHTSETTCTTTPTQATTSPSVDIPQFEPADEQLVRLSDYLPDLFQSLPYATASNFTGQVIYEFSDAYLRYGTAKKLQAVREELAAQGLDILIWDGFRPVSAQFRLWEACPDPAYVSDPNKGYSSHSRGNTVDLTLVNSDGNLLEMPTGFDDFSGLADRDYSDCTPTAAANAQLLQDTMEKFGFSGYFQEWWHFTDTQEYPVAQEFEPQMPSLYYAYCNEFISLRRDADTSAEVITRIPAGEEFVLLANNGIFALAQYEGLTGYVHRDYIQTVSSLANPSIWSANCEEFISLRKMPDSAEVLDTIPVGGHFSLLRWQGSYALVSYEGQEGYVLTSYIKPPAEDYFSSCLTVVKPTDSYSYDLLLQDMTALAAAYPDIVSLDFIGTSEEGRDIPVFRLGNPGAEYHVLLQGAIHGREHMTAWLLMAMTDFWLAHDISALGDVCYHIIPMSNPDGVAISHSGILNETQMAIYAQDTSLGFTSADAAEYAALWKANALGVDINRNFPSGWEFIDDREHPSSQQYRGPEPFCAAEAAALRDYTLSYDFDATVSYHASGSIIYYEYGEKQAVNLRSEDLGRAVSTVIGYGLEGSDGVDGAGYKDWAIDALEIPSLTIEIGCGSAPLELREIYSIFARNCGVLPAIAQWLQK